MKFLQEKVVHWTVGLMVVVGLLLIFGPHEWFPEFYAPTFMGVGALIFALILYVPPKIFKKNHEHAQRAVQYLQLSLFVSLSMSGLGELGLWQLYKVGFEYDKLTHFVVPFLLTLSAAYFLFWYYQWTLKKSLWIAVVGMLVFAIAWEGIEFYSDQLFGTQLFGVYGEQLSKDTVIDIIFDVLGVGCAWMFLLSYRKRWFRR